MKNKKRYSIVLALALLVGLSSAATASPGKDLVLTYEGGQVTTSCADVKLVHFLEALSQSANLDVIVVEPLDPARRVCVAFNRVPLHTVLDTVLKGYNYAVVINDAQSGRSSVSSYGHVDRVLPGKPPVRRSDSAGKPAVDIPREYIAQRIESLEKHIASGAADREYDKWSRVRGEKFAVNAREKLARYRQRLDEMHD